MWICPKCGRSFERQNQSHYCGNAASNVDAYVAAQDEAHQPRLEELVRLIRSVAPHAAEEIKWHMPSFSGKAGSIQFAACQKWISLYLGADVMEPFRGHLGQLRCQKDALYLPYDQPVPWEPIGQMIKQILSKDP